MKLIYLACPYSADTIKKMKARTLAATKKAAELSIEGYNVFSPLTHSDPIADHLPEELRKSQEFWVSRDLQILNFCAEMHVLMLDGWEDSTGVNHELEYAESRGIPIVYHTG